MSKIQLNSNVKKYTYLFIGVLVLMYIILKSFSKVGDFDVYLYASQQLFNGENIYVNNPINNYLYSPLFALLLKPISVFGFPVARVIWALINVLVTIRMWKLISNIVKRSLVIENKILFNWTLGVIVISLGYWNHNLILGQMTMFILWLSFEGLYQVVDRKKNVLGAFLLGLGIVIKIVPMLALFYLFFKMKFKAIAIIVGFVFLGLLLPSLFIGHNYNLDLLNKWGKTINPSNKKYVFEDSNGTVSLNATLPAYFFDFKNSHDTQPKLNRQIIAVNSDTLLIVLQVTRFIIVLSLLLFVFYKFKRREASLEPLYFLWEFSCLSLVSLLIFPHQQKYVLMYFVPAAAYMILFSLLVIKSKNKSKLKHCIIAYLSLFLVFIAAIMGRDIVGDFVVNIYDYYHVSGLIVMLFILFLILIKPDVLKLQSDEFYTE